MPKATLLLRWRRDITEDAFVEGVIWRVRQAVKGSAHHYKYRLAFVLNDACVVRFDNEHGKGDHKHIGNIEMTYAFQGPEALIRDFYAEVWRWMRK